MRRGARQDRREERKERRHDRRDDRGPAAKVAIGLGVAAVGAAAVRNHRSGGSSGSDSGSDDDGPKTYAMREKLLAFGNDFEIKKASRRRGGRTGPTAFYVDNKVVRIRETFNLRASRSGPVLYQIQERKARLRESMAIEDSNGDKIAELKLRAIGVVRDNFVVKIRGDTDWQVHGSILEHDFTMKEGGRTICKVHKNWVTPIKDCYFIDIDEDCPDPALALMVVIGLEDMTD